METKKTRKYYNFVDGPLNIEWIEQDTIKIENKILNVKTETYDFRSDNDIYSHIQDRIICGFYYYVTYLVSYRQIYYYALFRGI